MKLYAIFLIVFCHMFFLSASQGKLDNNDSGKSHLIKIDEFIYRFGGITIDQKKRMLEFNATCNQRNGLIEYALVHESGKTHESLFRTKVRPQVLHACFLLLKHPQELRFFENLWSDNPQILNFDRSIIKTEVIWDQNGTKTSKSLEELSLNTKNNKILKEGVFIFTGSKKIEGTYLAEVSGSMVAVYADEESIINSSHHDSNNDDVWIANKKEMPESEAPVVVRFLLPTAN